MKWMSRNREPRGYCSRCTGKKNGHGDRNFVEMSGCAIGDDSAVTSIAPAGISQQGICHDAKIHCCDPYRSSLLESRLQYNDADMRRQSQYKCVVKGLMESLQSDTGGDDRKP